MFGGGCLLERGHLFEEIRYCLNSIDFHLKVTNILMNGSSPGLPEIKGFDLTALTQDDLQNLQP